MRLELEVPQGFLSALKNRFNTSQRKELTVPMTLAPSKVVLPVADNLLRALPVMLFRHFRI